MREITGSKERDLGLERRFNSASPATRYEYVDVHFPSAGVDVVVNHSLRPTYPENVNYLPVQLNGPAIVYHDTSASRKPWGSDFILLRSNADNTWARLLLTIPSEQLQNGIVTVGEMGDVKFPGVVVPEGELEVPVEGTLATVTSPDITYPAGAMTYQKVRNWVHVIGFVTLPATANGNQAEINNLPFTVENSSQAQGPGVVHTNAALHLEFIPIANTTSARVFNPTTAAGITNAQLTTATLIFEFKYRASS